MNNIAYYLRIKGVSREIPVEDDGSELPAVNDYIITDVGKYKVTSRVFDTERHSPPTICCAVNYETE